MENANKDPMQILSDLTKNPEALKSMMSALGASVPPASTESQPQAITPTMPDLSAMLSDPQTLSKISGVMSMLKSSQANAKPSQDPHTSDKSAALLLALKPYLSADRQTAIENLIKFSKFGEILKNM